MPGLALDLQSGTLAKTMSQIACHAGHTQIEKILIHASKETKLLRVNALVFVGDAMEENPDKLEPFVAQPINDAGPSHNRGGLRFPAEPRRASDFRVPNNMDRVLARSRTHSGYPRSFFGGGNQP
jgi:hypothetical protein